MGGGRPSDFTFNSLQVIKPFPDLSSAGMFY